MFSKDEIRRIAQISKTKDELAKTIVCEIKEGAYSILESCILCRNYLTPSAYGSVLEGAVKREFSLHDAKNLSYGDADVANTGIEIKTSLGHRTGKWGLRQIRFDKHIKHYLVLLYDNTKAKIHYLWIPRKDMQDLVYQFGGTIHGTAVQHGKITRAHLQNTTKEFYLTFNKNAKDGSKEANVWNAVKRYIITTKQLKKELSK